jgi:hypothetical protein
MVPKDLADDGDLFVGQRRCGLADLPNVLLVRSRVEHVVQVGDSDLGLDDWTSVATAHLLRARWKAALPDASTNSLGAAAVALRRGGDVEAGPSCSDSDGRISKDNTKTRHFVEEAWPRASNSTPVEEQRDISGPNLLDRNLIVPMPQ